MANGGGGGGQASSTQATRPIARRRASASTRARIASSVAPSLACRYQVGAARGPAPKKGRARRPGQSIKRPLINSWLVINTGPIVAEVRERPPTRSTRRPRTGATRDIGPSRIARHRPQAPGGTSHPASTAPPPSRAEKIVVVPRLPLGQGDGVGGHPAPAI